MEEKQAPEKVRDHPVSTAAAFVVIAGLFCLAVVQPLFDLYARNAELFVIDHAGPAAMLSFSAILILVLPAMLTLPVAAAGFIRPAAKNVVLGLVIAILGGALALQPLKGMGWMPGKALVVIAAAIGAGMGLLWYFIAYVRHFLVLLSAVALVAVPAVFFMSPGISRILLHSGEPRVPPLPVPKGAPPIVMVIWDEFPDTVLMDGKRNIDETMYPSFARLARTSTWYRNATTVCDETPAAVSAILTGKFPGERSLPSFIDYPRNLFSDLLGTYEFHVMETHTQLYEGPASQPLSESPRRLLSDSLAVYLNLLLPSDLTGGLPDVTATWHDFWAQDVRRKMSEDRAAIFGQFVESIHAGNRPALYFLHLLLPHQPFEYLPSGDRYPASEFQHPDPGLAKKTGAMEAHGEHVIRHYQRHILQTQYVDLLMGRLLDRLEASGLYDRAMVIVTADHGISFTPGISARSVSEVNYPDVVSVPLFVKYPGQRTGNISDVPVRTIDIVPTILEVLGAPAQGLDGVSLLRPTTGRGKLRVLQAAFTSHREWFDFDPDTSRKYQSLDRKISLFGEADHARLFQVGPYRGWLGKNVRDIPVVNGSGGVQLQLHVPEGGYDLVPGSGIVPCLIYGRMLARGGLKDPVIGIAVNGRFEAFTRPVPVWKGESRSIIEQFGALVPEAVFHPGPNEVDLFVVSSDGKLLAPEIRR